MAVIQKERRHIETKFGHAAQGLAKVIFVVILANQILTSAFVYVVQQIDPGVLPSVTSLFSFATCGFVSFWLQADARRAYLFARERGCVTPADKTGRALAISVDCPKRWLVVLHIELNPRLVAI